MNEKFFKSASIILLLTTVTLSVTNLISYRQMKSAIESADEQKKIYEEKNAKLDTQVKEFDTNLQGIKDKYYEEKLTKLLDREQLLQLAKDQWKYSLKVNGEAFKEDHIYANAKDIMVVFSEIQAKDRILPPNIRNSGSLISGDKEDKFYDHLMVNSSIPYEKSIKTFDDSIDVYYTFKNVPIGTIITLKLSEPLKERMKITNDILEIFVNKIEK